MATSVLKNEFSRTEALKLKNLEEEIKVYFSQSKPWYKNSWVSLITTVLLTSADFMTIKMIFEKTIAGNGTLLAIVASYILNFVAILWVDSLKNMYYGIEKKKASVISLITGFFTFWGLFFLTGYLRIAAKELMFSTGATIIGSNGQNLAASTSNNTEAAYAVSLLLCFMPLATTLINALLAWVSYDPVDNKLSSIAKSIARVNTDMLEHEQSISLLSDENFEQNLKNFDASKLKSITDYLEADAEAFIDEIDELLMIRIEADSSEIDVLSKHDFDEERGIENEGN